MTPSGHPVGLMKAVKEREGYATLTLVLQSPVTDLHTYPLYTAWRSLWLKDDSVKACIFHKTCLSFVLAHEVR